MRHASLFALAILAGALTGCGSSSDPEPMLETDQATLDAHLKCTPLVHHDKPAVLLVHGTFTAGFEQYDWTYLPLLEERGYDVCVVTYPDRGFGDMQVSAEYIVNAIHRMREGSGRKIAIIGHSQGAAVPRWALRWWPSTRGMVEDFVLQAGPTHGTSVASAAPSVTALLAALGLSDLPVGVLPAIFFQIGTGSQFIEALNRDDETPGSVDYTSIYTRFDELVQPVAPVPTAAFEYGRDNPHVANILLQDVCPGLIVDHVTIGLTDRVTFDLTLDALEHDGPANVERAGGAELCNALPFVPSEIISSDIVAGILSALAQEAANGLPDPHLATAEPPLKPYAPP